VTAPSAPGAAPEDDGPRPAGPAPSTERRAAGKLYGRTATDLTGPLQPTRPSVAYRRVLGRSQHRTLIALGVLHIALAVALAGFLALPGQLPPLRRSDYLADALMLAGWVVMILLQLIAGVRTWALTFFAANAKDPVPMVPPAGLRVAVLTTIVPGKEPLELVLTTLRAMKRLRHDGPVDVWLLDEGDDEDVRRRCAEIGVRHFSRQGRPEWNQATGPFKAKTKHGNHNAWRSAHETEYDVVAQMDPDHVPYPNFLERTLGYFADPDTAFVVAPQVYGNLAESFVARGAAELAYLFHGILQRGGNGHGAPLLIGTNHLYRPAAFRQIGGYQDCIIEDHLTSMVVFGALNPATGAHWRGVYTPDVLAVGEGPATYSDFFSQQKRWAYGIWEIVRGHSPRLLVALRRPGQRLAFVALQLHYPTTAAQWVMGVFLSAVYLLGGVTVTQLPVLAWSALFAANVLVGLVFFWFTQRFNLVDHERRSWGLAGMALELVTAPIYVAAAAAQLAGRPLAYVVTAKGTAATGDTLRTFRPHLGWAAFSAICLVAAPLLGHDYPALYVWAALTVVICVAPVVHLGVRTARARAALRRRPTDPVSATTYLLPPRRLGELLVLRGLVSRPHLERLLDRQAGAEGPWRKLGELAVEEGLLTADQLADVLQHPRDRQLPLAG